MPLDLNGQRIDEHMRRKQTRRDDRGILQQERCGEDRGEQQGGLAGQIREEPGQHFRHHFFNTAGQLRLPDAM